MFSQAELINARVPWDDDVKTVNIDFPDYISQLLLCNTPPTEEELPQVTSYLQEAIEALLDVQEGLRSPTQGDAGEPALPTNALDEVNTLSTITKKIDAARIILSPVRRIPPEIIQEITLVCCYDPFNDNLNIPLAARFPLLLCRVSSEWRNAIESYTRLWSHLRCNPGVGRDTSAFNSTIQKYVTLAATAPVHLDLVLTTLSQQYERQSERFVSRTIGLLTLGGTTQIETLSVDFGTTGIDILAPIAEEMRFGSLPDLKVLNFKAPNQSSAVTVFKKVFADTPNLKRLYLEADHSFLNFDVLPQPMMRSLEEIELKGKDLDAAQWMLLVVGCKKLRKASFSLDGRPPNFLQAIRITKLPELTTLSLNFQRGCLYSPFLPFRWIKLQRLTTLALSFNSPVLPRIPLLDDNYIPKLSRLTHLSIVTNISSGSWGINAEGEPIHRNYINTTSDGVPVTIRRILSLARKDLESLELSLTAPLPIWRAVLKIWSGEHISTSGSNHKSTAIGMKYLHLCVPAGVIIRGFAEVLAQLVERQVNHPRCKLERLKVTIGVENYDRVGIVDEAVGLLQKGLDEYVDAYDLRLEHAVQTYQYQPSLSRHRRR
ncbi:hypothetical protein CVT24_010999 [Panaeolus cyanescens]|uniref:F-box domain-containing protein n=1 Tax=Panaeolus cyanescens TaxID=181874 RepID=A0A409YVD0_9AGAR|nr:hypothetical protein CVT24_010999 [Panaeolus cyanescens]